MPGFNIFPRPPQQLDEALIKRFHQVPVANISDCMHRMTAAGPRLRPLHKGAAMVGLALTVKTRPGDNLMIHKAIALAQPGDVIVVDGGGDLSNALIGELMVTYAASRGIIGFVINGSVRDSAMIAAGNFAVFAAGITHRGPYKDGPGEINVPIAIDGMVIHPGDLMVGDEDGLVCVPAGQAADILAAALAKGEAEKKTLLDMANGRYDTAWVDAALQRAGYQPDTHR